MTIIRSILLFVLAVIAEVGGAWLVWQGVREHKGLLWIGAGIAALGAYGFVATLHRPRFGRILAAYGGVFVAGSLGWAMAFDNRRPAIPIMGRRHCREVSGSSRHVDRVVPGRTCRTSARAYHACCSRFGGCGRGPACVAPL